MYIKDLFEKKNPVFSFEIFPPNKNFSEEKLKEVTTELATFNPDFISVTYGAGGTTKTGTIEMASFIKNELKTEVLAHLTCIGSKKSEINQFLKDLKNTNVKNILALRGDIPRGKDESIYDEGDYRYAFELVKDIKETEEFSIGGAFYPEVHYENNDLLDLFYLKNKVDLGVDFLISQLFFENETFYKFIEQARKININVPFVAGIIPITNVAQIKRLVSLSNCEIPLKLERILNKYGHDPVSTCQAGIAYATEQIIELLSNDVKGIHLYTMNKTETVKKLLNNLNFVR